MSRIRLLTLLLIVVGVGSGMAGSAGAATVGVSIGTLRGQFLANPNSSGEFDRKPADPVAFTQSFSVVNFNPPTSAQPCSNDTGVDENTRPFTNVIPQADGTCSTVIAQGSGHKAGVDDLESFDAVFTTSLTVSAAGRVTFTFFSDDGWILGIGAGPGGAQPTYVSGSKYNAPATSPFHGYKVVGAYNTATAPTGTDVKVNFPAAGTYPVELDYTECCSGELAFTMLANGHVIPANPCSSGGLSGPTVAYQLWGSVGGSVPLVQEPTANGAVSGTVEGMAKNQDPPVDAALHETACAVSLAGA